MRAETVREIRSIELKVDAIKNRVEDIVALADECRLLLRQEARADPGED